MAHILVSLLRTGWTIEIRDFADPLLLEFSGLASSAVDCWLFLTLIFLAASEA